MNLVAALGALLLGGLTVAVGNVWAWLLVALGLGLLWNYARDGGVRAAFDRFRQGDVKGVRHALRHTLWPGLLTPSKRAYYHWMEGVALASECRFPAAREQLLLAATGAIQTENDRCLIQCLLAEVAVQLEQWTAAAEHLRLARNLEHYPRIDAMIEGLEQRLRNCMEAVGTRGEPASARQADATPRPEPNP